MHIRRYWTSILIVIVSVSILIVLRMEANIDNEIFIAGVLSVLTLFISLVNHYRENDKFFKELFTEFNAKYDKMNSFLNTLPNNKAPDVEQRQRIIDYFNLCAEEYMWVKKGRIPYHIWKSWQNGIKTHLSNPVIKEIYEEERKFCKSSYYGFFDKELK